MHKRSPRRLWYVKVLEGGHVPCSGGVHTLRMQDRHTQAWLKDEKYQEWMPQKPEFSVSDPEP